MKKTRILAFFLALLMMLSVMPLSLFANEAKATDPEDAAMQSALEYLETKHTGALYEMPTVTGVSGAGVFREGYWNVSGEFVSSDTNTGFVIKDTAANYAIDFAPTTNDVLTNDDCFVFSMNVKRGTAMNGNVQIAGAQMKGGSWAQWSLKLSGDSVILGGSATAEGKVAFSTDVYTNFTVVYERATGIFRAYANGVEFATVNKEWINSHGFQLLRFYAGDSAISGDVATLGKMSIYEVSKANLDSFVLAKNPANGVFEIDGNYYFFENGVPALGKSLYFDGYSIETEANTGKIISCSKSQDMSGYYERWTSAQLQANAGTTLLWNGYLAKFNQRNADIYGYTYEEVTDGESTYYVVSPEKTLITYAQAQGTDIGDGFEFTKVDYILDKYYKSIPADAEEVKDEAGNIIGYKTTTAPVTTENADISYYHEFLNNTSYTDGVTNINFRLKVGEGYKDYLAAPENTTLVRFRYYLNGVGSGGSGRYDANVGTIEEIDGVPHLMMSDVDCGVLRSDIYTDLTMSTYIKDGAYVYDLYVNGVLMKEAIVMTASGVNTYKPLMIGTYMKTFAHFSSPLLTWGETQVYSGAKVNNNVAPLSGTKMTADGVYTYENGMAVSLSKGVAQDGTVGLKGYSVTLGETLAMNFYTALPKNAAKATVTVADKTTEIDLTKLAVDASGFYKLTASISSINVAETITLSILDAEGNALPMYTSDGKIHDGAYTASVKDYALKVAGMARIYGNDMVEVVKAMLNYAAYAEKYFGKNDDLSTAFSAEAAAKVTALDASKVAGTVYTDAENPAEILKSIQLVLDNTTKIRINLAAEAVVETELNNVVYVKSGNNYFIDIYGIDAKNLDTDYTLTVNGATVTISAVGAASVVTGSDAYSADFVNLMKALYLYSKAVNAL